MLELRPFGIMINTDVHDILFTLRDTMNFMGKNLLRDIKPSGDNIMITCPSHKDGQESKPSCGVHVKTGVVHCFTCGFTCSLPYLIGYCFGKDESHAELYGLEWLKTNFMEYEVEERPDIQLELNRNSLAHDQFSYVPEMVLDQYRYTHPYMYKRKLTDEVIELFDVGYDKDTKCITFPVRDVFGNCLFVARRAVDKKWFHYPVGAEKPLYGVYEWKKTGSPRELIVCESMFNCLTCWTHGRPAIALNGTGSYPQIQALVRLPVRSLILCLDPDEAGRKGTTRIKNNVLNKIISTVTYKDSRDLNDLSWDEFEDLMKTVHIVSR